MYNSEKMNIILRKNLKPQTITVQKIHKTTNLITIHRGKSYCLHPSISH